MAKMVDVSPTKGNLIRLQKQLESIRNRHDLLDHKREVLTRELLERMEKAKGLEEDMQEFFRKAHSAMAAARMRMGTERIEWISLSPTAELNVRVRSRTLMGVRIASAAIEVQPISPPYGPGDTSAALDLARQRWLDVLDFLSRSSEILTSVWKIAAEVRKTRRQVNALESAVIPEYKKAINRIKGRLEESEREEMVQIRKVKERQEQE